MQRLIPLFLVLSGLAASARAQMPPLWNRGITNVCSSFQAAT